MSSAYKHAMLQAFCVPVAQIDDADAGSYRLKRSRSHQQEPVEGWVMWASGIRDIIESCATIEALARLQDRQRPLLKAVSREQPDLYAQLGAAFAKRTSALKGERRADPRADETSAECATLVERNVRNASGRSVPRSRGGNCTKAPGVGAGKACARPSRRRSSQAAPDAHPERPTDAEVTEPA